MSISREIIDKLIEYQDEKVESLDWPYDILLEGIIDDVIEIVKEVAK